ncbi:amidohydrolase [Brevibacterium antiquum]|uniref:Predicted amidohydrolase YtcJ n=1 Tax=Brevibacterium antiquum TaxID=234835 RepID=A0A2H1JGD6_9MICO|nr:amidohydrolase [Brevibacterium antiquum]SMX86547.1 Predicted amidohydrolase YtcJ [Brevibacterium antiquum]
MRLFSNAVVRTFAPSSGSDAATSNAATSAAVSDTAPDSILVDGEKIVAVGTRAELLDIAAAESSTTAALASAGGIGATTVIPGLEIEEIDCAGQVILPGLVDAHMHSVHYADSLTDLDLSNVRSLAEAVAAIRERAGQTPFGEWVVGSGWDINKWDDPRYPDRELLDQAVPDHPVAMWSVDLHTLWTNAHGLEIAGIDDLTADPFGGEFVRDDEGSLTGLVREDATDLVARFIPEPTREEQVERLDRTQKLFLSQGLTGIHDFDSIASTLGWYDLREADRQHIRVMKYLRSPEVPWAIETGWHTGDGDDWLRRGGLKLFSDGALGSHTCHMSSPFPEPSAHDEPSAHHEPVASDEPVALGEPSAHDEPVALGETSEQESYTYPGTVPEDALSSEPADANYGITQMSEDDLFENARWATEAGISVAIHAIGDQANHHVLNVFERLRQTTREAEERFERTLRHRVEHAQFIQPADVARFAELDVIASMQPRHCISDLHLLHLIDESAQLAAYAWPDLLSAGAHVAFGSDGPVEPANPFAAIYAAMTRANISGDATTSFQPRRRLSAVEAIRQHTQGPAYAAGLDYRRGYLAPGMDADFIVVDTDPCAAEGLSDSAGAHDGLLNHDGLLGYESEAALFAHAEAIRDTTVALTVVGGQVKYSV